MERKTKYQYSYFLYPYIVEEKNYNSYIRGLLKDKNCHLEIKTKEKDLSLYTYFMPSVRSYLFWSFKYNKIQLKQFEELDLKLKASFLAKQNCVHFRYELGTQPQGKIGEEEGIFFDIPKIEIVCFSSGICFLILKTVIEGKPSISDILNFNYKFRDIASEYAELKEYENIRIQTNAFQQMSDLSSIIKKITKTSQEAKEMNLENERFLTYSYLCVEQEDWNEQTSFEPLQTDFMKLSHIMPASAQINVNEEYPKKKDITLPTLKYVKIGATRQGTVLFTSSMNTENYTKVPDTFEKEYLYTYLLALYKKIYVKKIKLAFKKKQFKTAQEEFIRFTQDIWGQEVTCDVNGIELYKMWEECFDLKETYTQTKVEYDIAYKQSGMKQTKTHYCFIGVFITGILVMLIAAFFL